MSIFLYNIYVLIKLIFLYYNIFNLKSIFLAFWDGNWLIKFLYSSSFNIYFSIDNITCRVLVCGPNPKIWGMFTQWAQNNKFLESGVKNWALINWTTTNMTLKGKLNITVDPNMYRFPVRGGYPWTKINRNWVSLQIIVLQCPF